MLRAWKPMAAGIWSVCVVPAITPGNRAVASGGIAFFMTGKRPSPSVPGSVIRESPATAPSLGAPLLGSPFDPPAPASGTSDPPVPAPPAPPVSVPPAPPPPPVATVLVPAPPLPVDALLDAPLEPEAVLLVVAVGVPLGPSSVEEHATRRKNGSMLAK